MKLRATKDYNGGRAYLHWCPGCKRLHLINVDKKNNSGAVWTFDGNMAVPTFRPSINIVGHCHYFITGGNIQFCSDSKHTLAGQLVPLPDLPAYALRGDDDE